MAALNKVIHRNTAERKTL